MAATILECHGLTGSGSKQDHGFAKDHTAERGLAQLRSPGCDVPAVSDEHLDLAVLLSGVENEISGAFCNHDGRSVGIAADDLGHDRRIADPELVQAVHAEPR